LGLLTAESDHGRIRSRSGSLQTAHSRGKEVGKSIIEEAAHEEEEGEEMESFLLQASPELSSRKDPSKWVILKGMDSLIYGST
jgi:hypothetical protein